MNKSEARERIRYLKKIIHQSTEKLAKSLVNNHYKTANNQSIIISGNLKELNKLRFQIKANRNAYLQT
jgi:hypothetical protein